MNRAAEWTKNEEYIQTDDATSVACLLSARIGDRLTVATATTTGDTRSVGKLRLMRNHTTMIAATLRRNQTIGRKNAVTRQQAPINDATNDDQMNGAPSTPAITTLKDAGSSVAHLGQTI